jgi:hypothetical protein
MLDDVIFHDSGIQDATKKLQTKRNKASGYERTERCSHRAKELFAPPRIAHRAMAVSRSGRPEALAIDGVWPSPMGPAGPSEWHPGAGRIAALGAVAAGASGLARGRRRGRARRRAQDQDGRLLLRDETGAQRG